MFLETSGAPPSLCVVFKRALCNVIPLYGVGIFVNSSFTPGMTDRDAAFGKI